MNQTVSTVYNASSLQVLEGLEPVRVRPGMYIGNTGSAGLRHLLWEILDNAVDEALAGHCRNIAVTVHKDGSYEVRDDGRGIPIDLHQEKQMHGAALLFTTLHAGGKFDGQNYKVSGGLHGVGAAVTNALSQRLTLDIRRDGQHYHQEFTDGGAPTAPVIKPYKGRERGTIVRFWPDLRHFEAEAEIDIALVRERMKNTAFLVPGLRLTLDVPAPATGEGEGEAEEPQQHEYCFEAFAEILDDLSTRSGTALTDTIAIESSETTPEDGEVEVSVALRWHERNGALVGFANIIPTSDGRHMTGLKAAATKALNDYAAGNNLLARGQTLENEDAQMGLVAAVAIRLGEPMFESQTKAKITNSSVQGVVSRAVREAIQKAFEEQPKMARVVVDRARMAQKAREAATKAHDMVINRKSVISATALPGKLADCQEQDASQSELFIVEGDSAGGSAKQGRDRAFQAILPLKGKILNTYRADPARIMKSEEVRNIIMALGCGPKTRFEIEKLRYHKIIILADADSDGAHIASLVLTFFHTYAPSLIENGYIYVALPPLYRVRKGKLSHYIKDERELKAFLAGQDSPDKWQVQRFKGLGEMNPEQLWDAAMNPETRRIGRVNYHPEGREHDEATFEILMGSEVPPRRKFIEDYAEQARIDI